MDVLKLEKLISPNFGYDNDRKMSMRAHEIETLPVTEDKKETRLIVFILAGSEFGIEINRVREIIRVSDITRMPKTPRFLEGIINLRGRIVSVLNLKKRFGFPACDLTMDGRIMIIDVADQIVGLLVDKVSEVLKIDEANLVSPTEEILTIKPQYLSRIAEVKTRLIVFFNLERIFNLEQIKNLADLEWADTNEERVDER
jgi:purine-binding chemotaxis protein CheW